MADQYPSRRIVVTGGRDWFDYRRIWEALEAERRVGPYLFGVGDCPTGADEIALRWALVNLDWPPMVFHAPWKLRGKAAGPIRNKFMIDMVHPTLVLAFVMPGSRGTVNCANYAEAQGIEVRRFFERRDRAQGNNPYLGGIRGADAQEAAADETDAEAGGEGGRGVVVDDRPVGER